MFKNSINGQRYVGSSENLKRRFTEYFNINHLTRSNYMAIHRAILKHGHENFSLTIFEYCEAEQCLEREDLYLSYFKPEYNINKKATAPFSGRTHSDDTKIIMSDAKKGENNPMFGKNLSEETRTKISESKKGKPKPKGSGSPSQAIEVTDIKNNTTISYDSISEAARALNINESSIRSSLRYNSKKPYKGQYTFKRL
jgi:group I intron endonuclease